MNYKYTARSSEKDVHELAFSYEFEIKRCCWLAHAIILKTEKAVAVSSFSVSLILLMILSEKNWEP